MKNVTSQRIEKTVLAWALIVGLAACDSAVTAPSISEPSDETAPSTPPTIGFRVEVTASTHRVQAGDLVSVELAIPSGRLGADDRYEVVLSWDGGRLEYLFSEMDASAAGLVFDASDIHEVTFEFWADAPEQGKNRIVATFIALQDGTTGNISVIRQTLLK